MNPEASKAVGYHVITLGLLLLAYVVLTALGHDANLLFGLIAGQGIGAGIQLKSTTPDSDT